MVTKGRAVVDAPLEDCRGVRRRSPLARVGEHHDGRSSPHPFIARIPRTFALLLPLLIPLLLCLLLGTAPLSVVALFLIHLPLVGGGLGGVWPACAHNRGWGYRG